MAASLPSRPRIKLQPAQKAGEKPGIDRHWRGLFLDTLAETSNVSQSSKQGHRPCLAKRQIEAVRHREAEVSQMLNEDLGDNLGDDQGANRASEDDVHGDL